MKENPPPTVTYSFTEIEEDEIARWIQSKRLLHEMKDKQYKDKALRRRLWEEKAAEYGVNYDSIMKWYQTQRTRFSKLREGRPVKKSQKRSGDGASSGDEEEVFLSEEATENDSDRDRFIRRIFGFLRQHIRRHKRDTPVSFKDKLALAETGELAGSDDSTITSSVADEPREPSKKYTGYPTPRPASRTKKATAEESESSTVGMAGPSLDLLERLVQFITRDQPENRATPFCKYLETELERLHENCLEPAFEDTTTVLNHYRKVSRQLRMKEAAGNPINPIDDIPSVFQAQQSQQCRPMSTSSTYPRVNQLQQESSSYFSSRPASPLPDFQPGPRQWPMNPPQLAQGGQSVWRSQDCGYVEQANPTQFNLEQQQ